MGSENVMTDPEVLDRYKTDEETDPHYHHLPEVVVAPANTEEVAAVMKIANEFDVPVTPRSAGTSVSCGAVPVCGGIVMLMERMDKILELNKEGMYMVVEAGARTLEIQEYANKEGFLYAGDPQCRRQQGCALRHNPQSGLFYRSGYPDRRYCNARLDVEKEQHRLLP